MQRSPPHAHGSEADTRPACRALGHTEPLPPPSLSLFEGTCCSGGRFSLLLTPPGALLPLLPALVSGTPGHAAVTGREPQALSPPRPLLQEPAPLCITFPPGCTSGLQGPRTRPGWGHGGCSASRGRHRREPTPALASHCQAAPGSPGVPDPTWLLRAQPPWTPQSSEAHRTPRPALGHDGGAGGDSSRLSALWELVPLDLTCVPLPDPEPLTGARQPCPKHGGCTGAGPETWAKPGEGRGGPRHVSQETPSPCWPGAPRSAQAAPEEWVAPRRPKGCPGQPGDSAWFGLGARHSGLCRLAVTSLFGAGPVGGRGCSTAGSKSPLAQGQGWCWSELCEAPPICPTRVLGGSSVPLPRHATKLPRIPLDWAVMATGPSWEGLGGRLRAGGQRGGLQAGWGGGGQSRGSLCLCTGTLISEAIVNLSQPPQPQPTPGAPGSPEGERRCTSGGAEPPGSPHGVAGRGAGPP